MKKKLSLVLAFALVFALTAPIQTAVAEEAEAIPRDWLRAALDSSADPCRVVTWESAEERLLAEQPELVDGFDADAYFAENYWYYEWTPEEYMEMIGYTREYFEADMRSMYLSHYIDAMYDTLLRETFEAAHPGELEAFLETGLDEYFAREYYYYDSKEEYMESYGYTEEEFINQMVDEWIGSHTYSLYEDGTIAALFAEFPAEAAAFDIDAYFAENYWYYDSIEEYASNYGYTVEEFERNMLISYYYTLSSARERQIELDSAKAALGGIPGEFGIMLNGAYLDLDGLPLIERDWCIYAPKEALLAALGVNILNIGFTPRAFMEGEVYYISVRDAAEPLGYDIYWDSLFETVVLIDKAAVIAALDENFTIVNGTLAAMYDQIKNVEATSGGMSMDVTLTQFSTLDENKDYTISYDAQVQSTQTRIAMQMQIDLAGMLDLLAPLMADISVQDMLTLAPLLPHLSNLEVSLIWDMETGVLHVNAPILSALVDELAEGDWLEIDTGLTMADLNVDLDITMTVGGLMYYVMKQQAATYTPYYWNTSNSPVYMANQLNIAAATIAAFVGDGAFVEIDGGHRLSIPADAVSDLIASVMGYYSGGNLIKEWVLNLDMLSDSIEAEFVFRPDFSGIYASLLPSYLSLFTGTPDFKIEAEFGTTAFESWYNFDLHVNNSMRVTINMASEQAAADAADVPTAPPAGAKVIDWMDIDWDSIELF